MIKTCVSSYSFGWHADESQLGIMGVIEKAKELGFDGIEFTENEFTTLDKAHLIRDKCEEVGITPVNFCIGGNLALENEDELNREIARIKEMVDICALMGAPMMRHDVAYGPFKRTYNTGYDAAIPYIAKGAREIAEYAESKGIRTMTENHGFFSQDALRVEKLVNAVNHRNFGALIDIGNFMCADEDPTHSVGIMTPYAFHVHCKDFYFKSGAEFSPGDGWIVTRSGNYLRGSIIGFGSAKAAQSIGVLKRSGFDGYMSIEFEGGDDVFWALEQGLKNLKRFLEL
ncbi:MAG: sugar phosphate isomerase/epimerase [Ruminococcaceae bacterium]|nr:sugar phosphate isomerase/epimerase [Oscillospiraceae bacterium]